ncbi:hypothetical protein PHYPO_G00045330 [Pangasianodon hypophthalmus]|uniref:Uncharacterized protein n=1 Tax=Pangasianodon hypophthalmus TaxID=310915 RepID=A0A5N5MHS7_PANHP|nr:hypothetical protein PHYPO_G00045330 [Pangasianodon hypophthalmus]
MLFSLRAESKPPSPSTNYLRHWCNLKPSGVGYGKKFLCRHATISKFFGDQTPNCAGACDYCQNPKLVRAQLERAAALSTKTGPAQSSESRGPFGFDRELYGGGKKGYGFERYDEEWEGRAEDDSEKRKKEFGDLFRKQMSLRKGSGGPKETFASPAPDADCPLKEASSQRIPRLTVKAREHCLSLLQASLTNCRGTTDQPCSSDPLSMAVEIEHEVFRSCKSANLYKAAVLKRVAELKKDSGDDVAPPVDEDGEACSSSISEEKRKMMKEEAASSSSSSSIPEDQLGFTSASQIYSLKRKRVGAGFRGSSTLFQTASEFLKTSKNDTLTAVPMSQEPVDNEEEQEGKTETKRSKTSPSVSSSSSSPSKKLGKALSKKQQKLAEAAKNSHCISQYFGKKMMDDTPKNGEATVLEPEETDVCVETPHNCNVVLNTNNTETQHECSTDMESTKKNARPVENQTMDVTAMDMSSAEVEMRRSEEAMQGFEERTMQEAEGKKSQSDAKVQPEKPCEDGESHSHPPTKFSRPPDNKRRVTFDPVVQERKMEADSDANHVSLQPVTLKEAADIVVRILDPFYKKGKFATKDLFKSFARFLSHLLVEGKAKDRVKVKMEAKSLIKRFFSSIQRCENETDWKHLQDAAKPNAANRTAAQEDR